MAVFRLWPATDGPAAVTSDTENYTLGTEFFVSEAADAIAVLFWRPADAPATTLNVGIFNTSGTLLASVLGVSVPAGLGAWHRVPLDAPLALSAAPTSYVVAAQSSTNNFYSATSGYWTGGGAGESGIVNGILNAPNSSDTIGNGQSRFSVSSSLSYPGGSFNSTNYWVDVEVDDGQSVAAEGSASGTVSWDGTATGETTEIGPNTGSASGTVAWAGEATSARVSVGATSGTVSWAGSATGDNGEINWLTVAEENALTTGRLTPPSWMDYPSESIPVFARSTYYRPGETAGFSVDHSQPYDVWIFRLGWYGGDGARRVAQITGTTANQPAPVTIPDSNGAVTCAAWSTNVTWDIPEDATPGYYLASFRDTTNDQWASVPFVVSDADAPRPVIVVSSEATWHAAYNGFGGNNLYGASLGIGSAGSRALCVSYDKPVITRDHVPQTHFYNGELAQLRMLERFGFQVAYTTCEQVNDDPSILDGRSLIVFSGHNEYISQRIRDKVAERLAAGVNIANFAANDFFWRTAYAGTSFPTGNTDTSTGRVMWCRKDTMDGPTSHPGHNGGDPISTEADWTGTWQDTRWSLREPSTDLLGDRFIANGIRNDAVLVPASMKDLPIWRDCDGIQALGGGQQFSFGAGTLGMEWDFPDGTLESTPMSESVVNLDNNASDINGENYNTDGTYTHAFQAVANGSGRIINTNTTQWGWAVDDLHDRGTAVATSEAVQATLNILYDLGVTAEDTLVTGGGFTEPTPVADFDVAYSLAAPSQGAASGTISWTGTAEGARVSEGDAVGTIERDGEASGVREPSGVSTGTISWEGAATGSAPSEGAISGTLSWTGSTSGARSSTGAIAGTHAWAGSATGEAAEVGTNVGAASGTVVWTGNAAGMRVSIGAVVGTIAWTGSASGKREFSGSAAASVAWTGTATGVSDVDAIPARDIDITVRGVEKSWFIAPLAVQWFISNLVQNPSSAGPITQSWSVANTMRNPTNAGVLSRNPISAGTTTHVWSAGPTHL